MAYETLLTSLEDGVMTVTLNRPDKLNAFNTVMSKELIDFFQGVNAMDEVRALGGLAGLRHRPTLDARRPFVEAVHRDDAAVLLEVTLERRLLGDRLGSGIDHLLPDLAVLRPHRDQTPVEHLQLEVPIGRFDDAVDVVGRRHVEVLTERLDVGLGAEVLGDPLG